MNSSSPNRLSRPPALTPSSPKRRPLAQRSQSEANSSTIRLIASEDCDVYSKSPFPHHTSHVLPPRISKLHPQRYAPFEDKDVLVSDENNSTNHSVAQKRTSIDAPSVRSLNSARSIHDLTSTSLCDVDSSTLTTTTLTTNDTLLTTPSSSRQSSRTTPPSSPIEEARYEKRESQLDPVYEEAILQTPIRPTIRAVPSDHLPLSTKKSEASLTPSASTLSLNAQADQLELQASSPLTGNFLVFPYSSSEVSLDAGQDQDLESSPTPSWPTKSIPKYTSGESLVVESFKAASSAARSRSNSFPSRPTSGTSTISTHTAIAVQYPIVRPPSTSGSWANSAFSTQNLSRPRMREDSFRPQQWSSRLSTIASESERSNSYSTSTDSGRRGKRRKTIGSFTSGEPLSSLSDARSSEWEYGSGVLTGTESNTSFPIPQPLFTPRPLPAVPDESFSQSRDSDERDDIVGELQSPYLRSQRSGILTRFSSKSSLRPSSADSTKSRGSQISFIGDLMWARRYYSNSEPMNMIARNHSFVSESSGAARLPTATSGITSSPVSETVPANLWRPRNRPHESSDRPERRLRQETRRIFRPRERRQSAVVSEQQEVVNSQDNRRVRSLSSPALSIREMMYSPHLRRDRRQTQRYSTWAAPSFEEPMSTAIFSTVNRQIFCFAMGFILPMSWWVASFLPLPPRPSVASPLNATNSRGDDLPPGSASPSEFSLQEKRWQKAQWWRRVNRVLGVFGLVLVGTIVALAVIGTRGNGFNSSQPSRTPITVPLSSSAT